MVTVRGQGRLHFDRVWTFLNGYISGCVCVMARDSTWAICVGPGWTVAAIQEKLGFVEPTRASQAHYTVTDAPLVVTTLNDGRLSIFDEENSRAHVAWIKEQAEQEEAKVATLLERAATPKEVG